MERYKEVEHSIIKKYRRQIWSKFLRALETYELLSEGDKVAVCISGGKDSFLLAKCIQEAILHGKVNFEAKYIAMNPGYNQENLERLKANAKMLNIPIIIFDAPIFDYVSSQENNPCYVCARMRRGYLYEKAKSLGCNKIALGHHFDDVIETTLMGMFYNSELTAMRPKLPSLNFEGMELIRPLYLIKEHDIESWVVHNNLSFLNCACPLAEKVSQGENVSKRKEVKQIIKNLKKDIPELDEAIFRSIHNVNYNTMIGYRENGVHHLFTENYSKKEG